MDLGAMGTITPLKGKKDPDPGTAPMQHNRQDLSALQSEFGHFLIGTNLIDEQVLDRADRASRTTGERLDRVLTKLGLISENDLTAALCTYLGIDAITPSEIPVAPVLADIIGMDFVRHNKILPLAVETTKLKVGVVDPFADEPLRALAYLVDLEVAVSLFTPTQFEKVFEALYPASASGRSSSAHGSEDDGNEFDVQRLRDLASEAPTIKLVNQIIGEAVETGSSDIHIEPTVDAVLVRYRIDGVLRTARTLSTSLRAAITSRIKIMSRLDIAERRLPQDGRTKVALRGVDIDFRVSTIPTAFGESVVMRILDRSRVELDFTRLGFQADHIAALHEMIKQPDGIILVTGPTGSGKTTTLYTALKELNTPELKIFTVEDPIEYQLAGINQVQVHASIGLSFPAALRSILRQDPDVIMIGEIRDLETARIAIQASLTGHLVLSTLHTNGAAATVTRLIDMGIENYLLTSTLKAVVAQRLVRSLCPHCSVPDEAADFWIAEFRRSLPAAMSGRKPDMRQKSGCEACGHTGFSGRSTIAEVLILDTEIRRLILASAPDTEIEAMARTNGMVRMYEDGVQKVLRGETAMDEVMRATRSG
jgi:general secretion pathway protein E